MPVELLERMVPLLVSIIAAVTPIVVAIVSSGNKSRKEQKQSFDGLQKAIEGMDKRLETVETHAEADYKNILQIQILSEEMPVEVRLEAGEKYVSQGWNGAIKAKYELLKEEYKKREKEIP